MNTWNTCEYASTNRRQQNDHYNVIKIIGRSRSRSRYCNGLGLGKPPQHEVITMKTQIINSGNGKYAILAEFECGNSGHWIQRIVAKNLSLKKARELTQ